MKVLSDARVGAWCVEHLGSAPARILFETGHLSQVLGVELIDGRLVVVKIRGWQDRLVACGRVQQHLFERGFPAPELISPPALFDGYAVSAETLIEGGRLLGHHPRAAPLFAEGLCRLIGLAPRPDEAGSLEPSPPWVGWDQPGTELWPKPDDRPGDLNAHDPGDWLDAIGAAVRARLRSYAAVRVVGHGDWYSQNLHWAGEQLRAVHDWDSVVAQAEVAIVGQSAAVWPATGGPGELASIKQTELFLEAYGEARGHRFSPAELEVAWAAGLWNRAFDAKKASLAGEDTDLILTRSEAAERARRAGLKPRVRN